SLENSFDVRRCRPGDTWEIVFSAEGEFARFFYQGDPLFYYIVTYNRQTGLCSAERKEVQASKARKGAAGTVKSSLYTSMSDVGIAPELVMEFAEVFASRVDFFTECETGDGFVVLWDCYKSGEKILKNINLVAGMYRKRNRTYQAYYFEGRFYDEKGDSLERDFLKAPLSYRRISSFFSYRRRHPVTGIYRPHLGIDYAAPAGTPVSAIGDGRIDFAGWMANGYGNAVKIKHGNGYISYYGHLSGFARGVRKGRAIRKGQVIGYVGSTGCSTGPHLDFRLSRNGQFVNLLRLETPPRRPLPQEKISDFLRYQQELMAEMESLAKGFL
ncbi:MAG: M23 family metallopeptidase, partial [Candidatus Omnitrophica bacterium]|nr:M23 family metallopeptidase [Candidatus Omnitrophota bacterium]